MIEHLNLGVYGLVIGNVTFALVVCILNWISIGKRLRYHQEIRTTFLLPLLSSAVMGACAWGVYVGIRTVTHSYRLGFLVAVPVAMVIYGLMIILTRSVTEDELRDMPFGMRIVRLCRKLHLM